MKDSRVFTTGYAPMISQFTVSRRGRPYPAVPPLQNPGFCPASRNRRTFIPTPILFVGPPGIEPGPHVHPPKFCSAKFRRASPKPRTKNFCRSAENRTRTSRTSHPPKFPHMVGAPGIEPGLHAPEACVLPLYDAPVNLGGRGVCTTTILHSVYVLVRGRRAYLS